MSQQLYSSSIATPKRDPDNWCQTTITGTEFTYWWTIFNFSLLRKEVGDALDSSVFTVDAQNSKTKWNLKLYPNGEERPGMEHCEEEFLTLYLMLLERPHGVSELFGKFTFSILNIDGVPTNIKESKIVNFNSDQAEGCGESGLFIKRKILADDAAKLLPNDKLTICCDLTVKTVTETVSRLNIPMDFLNGDDHLSEYLRFLVRDKMLSDVTLTVEGREFHVHQNVLATQSAVFSTMFQSTKTDKNRVDKVNIVDVSAETLEILIEYMYTGKTSRLNGSRMIIDVLCAANKYALRRLKTLCEFKLAKMISVENAAEILMVSQLNDAKNLKELALEYIITHSNEVVETEGWQLIEDRQPRIAADVAAVTGVPKENAHF